MTLQKVLSRIRQAVDDYHMIEEGDRIAVGISGGKDSLTLLLALYELSKFYPKHFTVIAVTVNLGFQNLNLDEIRTLCADRNIPYWRLLLPKSYLKTARRTIPVLFVRKCVKVH